MTRGSPEERESIIKFSFDRETTTEDQGFWVLQWRWIARAYLRLAQPLAPIEKTSRYSSSRWLTCRRSKTAPVTERRAVEMAFEPGRTGRARACGGALPQGLPMRLFAARLLSLEPRKTFSSNTISCVVHGDYIQSVGMTQIAVWTKWKFIVQSEDEETGEPSATIGKPKLGRSARH
jgi:hypothetical protein